MKSTYVLLSTLLTFFLLFPKCSTDYYLHEDINSNHKNNNVAAIVSIANYLPNKQDLRKASISNNMILANDNQSIEVSMEEEKWEDKVLPKTKTTWTNSSNVVSWSTGDNVGVYMRMTAGGSPAYADRNNVQHTVGSSGVLTPNDSPIYFPRPYTSANNVTFYAYYPYSSTAATNSMELNYTLPSDQSSRASLANADIMSARSTSTNGLSPTITLPFQHQMVLLSFRIKSLLLSGTLSKITLSGTAITNTGTLNLNNSSLTPNTALNFTPSVTTNQAVTTSQLGYVDIIVNPFTLATTNNGNLLLVTLTFGTIVPLVHTTRLVATGNFVAGTRYTYTLTVAL